MRRISGWTLVAVALCLLAFLVPHYLLKTGHHPPVGVYIAVMGGLAAAVSFRKEPSRPEKAIWILLITLLIVAEIRNLYVEAEKQQQEASSVSNALENTNKGLGKTLEGLSGLVDRLKGLSNGISEAINTETGGNSFCYLDFEPGLYNIAGMTAIRVGKYPLRGVNAKITDRAKIGAATDALIRSRAPDRPNVDELMSVMQEVGTVRQRVGDFATPARFIGGYQMVESEKQSFDIVFGSFNAEWIERLELRHIKWKMG